MKKIDFHIHTKSTISDSYFEFDIDSLKKYIQVAKLDAIAITNHNLFDKTQYKAIVNAVDIVVFPGIEVNLENGHLLVVSNNEDIDDFESKCNLIQSKIINKEDSISYDEFTNIFGDLKQYLIIPHYQKNPEISQIVLNKLSDHIEVLEVGSIKKWSALIKDSTNKTPVIFSDVRIKRSMQPEEMPVKQTYIDIDDITIPKLKVLFRDKNKIRISSDNEIDSFQILHDGTNASNKLNIIFGKRSSGKTHTLEAIYNSNQNQKIKYIKQFELVNNSGKEKFKEIIEKEQQETFDSMLKEFKDIVDIMKNVTEYNYNDIDDFLTSLKEYAMNKEKEDIFSKCKLFAETRFSIKDNSNLSQTISALITIIENEEHKDIIQKFVDYSNLKRLLIELIDVFRICEKEKENKEIVNKLVEKIKEDLGKKSALNPPQDLDFGELADNQLKIKMFEKIANCISKEVEFRKDETYEFKVISTIDMVRKISDFNKKISFTSSLRDVLKERKNPYKYLLKLKEMGVDYKDIYKCFWKIEFKVVNKHGNELSGGEKAEYNLLAEIKDSYKYDILLIDEPESSFDNVFIKEYVINMIKDISEKTTVFLVTHNNTLGMLMSPDCIIYTEHVTENNENKFLVYTGKITSKELVTITGERVKNYDILLNTMEAGEDAYERRKTIYETVKD